MTLKIIKALFVFALVFSLSGCSMLTQYRESEQVILISAVGFDKKDNTLVLSAETVSKSDESDPVIIMTSGRTAKECLTTLKKTADAPLLFSHCGAVIIGQSMSVSEAKEILLYLCSDYEFPLSSYAVSCENALSLLKGKGLNGGQTGYSIMRILKENNSKAHLFEVMREEKLTLPVFKANENNYYLEDSLWTER